MESYIRLEEYQIADGEEVPADAIAGSIITVDVLDEPLEENDEVTVYCGEPVKHNLYF